MPAKDLKSVAIAAVAAAALMALMALASPVFAASQLVADGGFGGVLETKEHDLRMLQPFSICPAIENANDFHRAME